jgi:hypothetical protein
MRTSRRRIVQLDVADSVRRELQAVRRIGVLQETACSLR